MVKEGKVTGRKYERESEAHFHWAGYYITVIGHTVCGKKSERERQRE